MAGDKSKETEQLRKDIGSLGDLETESKDNLVDAINEVGSIQPDWNQNDETKKDYIKNRPLWKIATEEDIAILLTNQGYISPVGANDGAIYTDNNGEIYVL